MRQVLAAAVLATVVQLGFISIPAPAQDTAPAATRPAAADVPVRQVVLFSSGVGYFEHFGTVKGDGSTELRFKTQQINDILKSLVLQDLDGGRVSTITYPSHDPIDKTLKSFQVDITSNPPLADLLNQLRGAKVTVQQIDQKQTGTILGVEKKKRAVGKAGENEGEAVEIAVLNLITGGRVVSIQLDDVQAIELEDAQLQEELTRALEALAQARDQDKKPVQIQFTGEGDRRVRLGYVVETPVWKTSYRLILEDGAAGAATRPADEAKPQAPARDGKLQGWAIVENQTDNDWTNVQLSLVSGRPISFVMDLYQPLYVPRPVVEPELYASLRPQMYAAGIQEKQVEEFARRQRGVAADRMAPAATAPAQVQVGEAAFGLNSSIAGDFDYFASVQSAASAAQLGELFQYTVGNVSLPRQKSAMIPIVTDDVEVERLSIYNHQVLARHPLNGARLKNTTGKHLLQGPITVIDANAYAGDAKIDNLPPGEERLLSYGIDLQVTANATNRRDDSALLTGKIVKGVLQLQRKDMFTQEYLLDNKSQRTKTIIIEHPFREGWELVDTEKPVETTDRLYRFRGEIPAGQARKRVVKEQRVRMEALEILPADIGQLVVYARTSEIPEPVRQALQQAVALKQRMVDTQRQIDQRNEELKKITEEQNRIRENLRTVQQNTQYYNRLMTKLNDQESSIETLQSEIEQLTEKLNQQRKELEDFVANMNVG